VIKSLGWADCGIRRGTTAALEVLRSGKGVTMKKQIRGRKLSLDQATIRSLTAPEALREVAAGVTGTCLPCSARDSGCNGPLTKTQ
jgi:hypothetical protein